MYKKRKSRRGKLNNAGSAIVTVIVVVAFVSILATTILYVSGMNYYMKMTDLKTKQSFYEAETALEEIKAALAIEVSAAGKEAYTHVMINYAAADGYSRYSLFENKFFEVLYDNWESRRGDPAAPLTYLQVLAGMVDPQYQAGLSLDGAVADAGSIDLSHRSEGYALLRGVILQYTDANGYTTMITTDYIITVPEMNWGVDQSKVDWADGYEPSKLERGTVDVTEYVKYYNWIKK